MTTPHIDLEIVDNFPNELEPGVLYVSIRFASATHLCACGCGGEVVTPLSPEQWKVTFDGEVSVWPSIGNWALPCQSHYVIDRGRIRWARGFSQREIELNRALDGRGLERMHNAKLPWWRRIGRRLP